MDTKNCDNNSCNVDVYGELAHRIMRLYYPYLEQESVKVQMRAHVLRNKSKAVIEEYMKKLIKPTA